MQTFSKAERLCSSVLIENLFKSGISYHLSPFKFVWLEASENNVPVKTVIRVPKRLFKKAVDRNRLKRMIREAYRKNKNSLYDSLLEKKIHLMIVFTAKSIIEYKDIEEKIIEGLQRLVKEINQ